MVDEADRADALCRAMAFFLGDDSKVERFAADDTRPYDGFSPSPGVVAGRLRSLERVSRGGDVVVVAEARALLQRIPDRATRRRGTRQVAVGDTLDRDAFARWLSDAGYLSTSLADAPGRFAVRGDAVDVWPAGAATPSRIEWFDDEVEGIRRLDLELRPKKPRQRLTVLPAREERIDAEARERLAAELQRLARSGDDVVRRRRLLEDLAAGVRPSGLQDWLPALVSHESPLQAFADLRCVVIGPGDVAAALRDHEATVARRYSGLDAADRPLVPPAERYVPVAEVLAGLEAAHAVHAGPSGAPDLGARLPEGFAVRGGDLEPAVRRVEALADEDVRVILVAESEERASRVEQMFEPHGVRVKRIGRPDEAPRGRVSLCVGDAPRGFVAPASGWCVIPMSALFGARVRADRERAHALFDTSVQSAAQLRDGDVVVHRVHGVGRYHGLVRLPVHDHLQDFAKLEYRGGDILFLPVAALDQLSRFNPANADAQVSLDRLGGASWQRRKGKVRDNLLKMAEELLRLHARRELATRPEFADPGDRYRAFEARFPHVETPDQADAILSVQEDLSRPYPMDRLICGDVGFGKTEVAMRAAMRAVESHRQVVVLCPTTVLAYQHYRTFTERFAHDPDVRIGMLSRFSSAGDAAQVRADARDGSLDILVGTTAVLGRDLVLPRLGLVVIDEEHRFGVQQKDRLKKLRAEVDVLSMSATPIPRTLQLAMGGLREMSLIATPPSDRLAVRTSVAPLSEARVRDALRAELERGGQAYVVHNRVETIERFAAQLREWLPDVRFAVAHGQMDADTLEGIVVSFIERQVDVLVCTTIFESGIDLPNVNTMIIDRADRFGLAQLYQLRGRVGRSDRRATCLLLAPESIPDDARKRLDVLVENSWLGSGFTIASADLELRGGGNILGAAQSGNIDQVGWDTWVELLEQAVQQARGEADRDEIEPEIDVPVDAFLPDALITDPQERLGWYRRFARALTPAAVEGLAEELEGWVGALPVETQNLVGLAIARLECKALAVERLTWMKVRMELVFHPHAAVRPALERAVAAYPKRFEVQVAADERRRVSIRFTPREAEAPFRFIRWVFTQLRRDP